MSLQEMSFLWTWDTRMDWCGDKAPIPEKMASPDATIPYYGNEKSFIDNYRRLVDFMSDVGLKHVLIWGLLRDSHGGVNAAIEICEYARAKNVGIIAGIGTQGYGGVYYDGEHEFNSSCWLAKHPELREDAVQISQNASIALRGKAICPSNPANIEWLTRGLEWLIETVPVDGLYLENGDYINCACETCNRRRREISDIYDIYFRSLTLSYQPVIDFIRENHPDIPVINTLYTGFNKKFIQDHSGLFKLASYDNVYNMWTMTNTTKKENWEKGISFINDSNIGYYHYFSTANNSQRMTFANEIYHNFKKMNDLNFKGVSIYGEVSANSIVGLINYITFAECIEHSDYDYDEFISTTLPECIAGYGFDIDVVMKELLKVNKIHFGSCGL